MACWSTALKKIGYGFSCTGKFSWLNFLEVGELIRQLAPMSENFIIQSFQNLEKIRNHRPLLGSFLQFWRSIPQRSLPAQRNLHKNLFRIQRNFSNIFFSESGENQSLEDIFWLPVIIWSNPFFGSVTPPWK